MAAADDHAHHAKRWLVPPGSTPGLHDIDTRSTEGAPGSKAETEPVSDAMVVALGELQTRLWAEDRQSLLIVLQAMDAGGKDGTIRKVFTGVNPQGVRVASFKAPTPQELDHDFLWRINKEAPGHGELGVFNRSHYEDVLIARVDELVPEAVWRARFEQIRNFESTLSASGTRVVKFFLHISKDEQAERLQARLDDPTKRWKFAAADLDVRKRWDDYQVAYEEAIGQTSVHHAPWYVIPADRKWYRNWAILNVLLAHLHDMDPQFPPEEPGLDGLVVV
ncbi:polyphosphate kinase 2 family protein [Aquihabitans sp. McL0605]|uniref:polyphosphate kinase 2 family protein n=1 Tax=Aquihabitans sp. McL0605 TaxID=3415671 RepID=UPI003CF8CE1B